MFFYTPQSLRDSPPTLVGQLVCVDNQGFKLLSYAALIHHLPLASLNSQIFISLSHFVTAPPLHYWDNLLVLIVSSL